MSAGEEDGFSMTSSTPSSPGLELACETSFSHLSFTCPGSSSPNINLPAPRHKPESKPKQVKDCKVCGDDTTGTYFGAVVCLPCKTFFIRYGAEGGRRLRCRNKNNCPVTMSTRTRCKYCRLMKCFSVGMARKERPEVIHAAQGQELCSVCSDIANGIHFGTYTCEGCKKFFRRGLKEHQSYRCALSGDCVINPRSRNTCRFCRYQKCLFVGMTSRVRVGRPRKVQRESILHAAQSRNNLNNREGSTELQKCNKEGAEYFQKCQFLPMNSQQGLEEQLPSAFRTAETSRISEHVHGTFPGWKENIQHVIEISPEDNISTTPSPDLEHVNEKMEDEDSRNDEDGQLSCDSPPAAGHVQIDGYTYVLSETLQDRFYQVILPYWRNPSIPSGYLTLSHAQKSLIQNVTSCHQDAINSLRGSTPSATVVLEAQNSVEMTRNVAEYMRHRLVRVLTSFIRFIKCLPVLQNIQEVDMSLLLRMNVSTWALVGAATHFFSPLSDSLPRSLVDIQLHSENPHAALNDRNVRLAKRIHALNMDDSEAALLSIICVLATDLAKMNDPEAVEKTRWTFLEAFQAYATLKYGNPNRRLEELFALVPEMRLAAIWFNDLSYLTWFPSAAT